ncbi:sugar transporter ERD6-like 6 [Lathyrus oleraceus]|uniref:sugar transporter ERD6-like 6 n=1 Tax=Pisum sativum TaxID=3888 RepID=UPI0021D25ADA|nr:sugar transporter ERD6-like 6 [Pisum sativum]
MFRVLATILTLWLADKSGRQLLLIVSSSAMALSLLVVSISFYLKEYISPDSDLYATLSLISVAGVVVMVIAFSLGLGAMPWIIMSEILPINIKGLAGSFATLANWFFSWLVTLTANLLLDWSSRGTFTIYTAVCVFTAGFVAIWVPETKGKTLEEIQHHTFFLVDSLMITGSKSNNMAH